MNYFFFGSPEFAAIVLERLIAASMLPGAVICNPDRPVGRKKTIAAPPVKRFVKNEMTRNENSGKEIAILQPEHPSSLISHLSSLSPDFFLVAAYAKILPKEILAIPRLGTIGIHPSLLPKYRGTTPIQSAILAGEQETGVTLYRMDEKADHGPVLVNAQLPIVNSHITYTELRDKLAELGAALLIETIPKFVKGEIVPVPQDETRATYTKKFKTDDAFVAERDLAAAERGEDPERTANIDRMIRALNPEPGVWTTKNGRRLKLLRAKTKDGKLVLSTVQEEGKRPREIGK